MVHFLRQAGHGVQAYDLQEIPRDTGTPYQRLDVAAASDWEAFDDRVEAVFFFAGLTGTDQGFAQAERYVQVNEGGLLHLLERIRATGRSIKVIFPSTRLVYRGSEGPLSEEAPKETKTIYAVNKLACEHYLAAYHNAFGIPYAVLRICVPYGNVLSDGYSYGTIGFFLRMAREGRAITLFGGGMQKRTFTHVADIYTACARIADRNDIVAGLFNIGGEAFALHDIAVMIADTFGATVESAEWPAGALKLESGDTVFDDAKLVKEIGDYRRNDFKDWLATNFGG